MIKIKQIWKNQNLLAYCVVKPKQLSFSVVQKFLNIERVPFEPLLP